MRTFILCISLMGFAIVLRPLDHAGAGFDAVAGTSTLEAEASSEATRNGLEELPILGDRTSTAVTSDASVPDVAADLLDSAAEPGLDSFASERRMWEILTELETVVREGDFTRRQDLVDELARLFAGDIEQAHDALAILGDAAALTTEVRDQLVRAMMGVPDEVFQDEFRRLMVELSRASRDSYPKNAAFVVECISDLSRPDLCLDLVRRMPGDIAADPRVAAELESLARYAVDPELRSYAIKRLTKGVGEACVPLLIELAADRDAAARVAALTSMKTLKTTQGGDLLLRFAKDTSELGDVRCAAMGALGYHARTPGVTDTLIEHCFYDPDDNVRVHALHALAKHATSSEDAARALYRVLQESDDEQAQIVAAMALRRAAPLGDLVGELEAMRDEAEAPAVASLLGGVIKRWTADDPGGVPR